MISGGEALSNSSNAQDGAWAATGGGESPTGYSGGYLGLWWVLRGWQVYLHMGQFILKSLKQLESPMIFLHYRFFLTFVFKEEPQNVQKMHLLNVPS